MDVVPAEARHKEEQDVNVEEVDDDEARVEAPSPIVAAENLEVTDNSAVGKIRAIFGMLTKFIGVKDIVNLRVSLPANLLDPVSNLESWNYMDRPDTFIEMADPDDPVDRMLKVIKYWFAKDARFTNNRIAKPYNSILGEQFLCHCDVDMEALKAAQSQPAPATTLLQAYPLPNDPSTTTKQKTDAPSTELPPPGCLRVYCITEQISHHPPVSAYYYYSPDKKIIVRGVDHVCAKFTGTCMKVFPGAMNRGIYITMQSRENEEYLCTHPTAYINGWLKASLYLTIGEQCVITCPRTRLRAVLEYKDESFFGSPKYLVQGKIYRYDADDDAPLSGATPIANDTKINFAKIPDADVVCHINGCWRGVINYQKTAAASTVSNESVFITQTVYPATDRPAELVDMTKLQPLPKSVPPLDLQSPHESRRIWHDVTQAIVEGRFDEATKAKRQLEDKQRSKNAERKSSMELHHSHWFMFPPGNDKTLMDACVSQPQQLYGYDAGEYTEKDSKCSVGVLGKPYFRMDRRDELPWIKHAKAGVKS